MIPDMFIYGEAELPSTRGLFLKGYKLYFHRAYLNTKENFRRGLAIFYRTKYEYLISKVYACRKFDIVWMQLKTNSELVYFCFFYAPGSHHNHKIRSKFYDIFIEKAMFYASQGKVFLVGDSNARLGSVLEDRNIHGQLIINKNNSHFREFLDITGFSLLNCKYCKGEPTYEIINKKKSILDVCLTNAESTIVNMKIGTTLGANSQTCHKPLLVTICLPLRKKVAHEQPTRKAFHITSQETQSKIIQFVASRMNAPDYLDLKKYFKMAKVRFQKSNSIENNHQSRSPQILNLQYSFSRAVETMLVKKDDFSVFMVQYIEKLLGAQSKIEKYARFEKWVDRMDSLDFNKRTRLFYSSLRKKQRIPEMVGPIQNKLGTLSTNLQETLNNWTEFYRELYSTKYTRSFFPTPNEDSILDGDFSFQEFLDILFVLKNYKAPGFDHITNEDMTFIFVEDPDKDPIGFLRNQELLTKIYGILTEFWFNEWVPPDFKRTILRPFLKDNDKDSSDPSNYRPVSLLNTLMKVYEAIICKRLVDYLESNNKLSVTQAAYRKGRSTCDHILVIHELFLEYRYNKVGPRGGPKETASISLLYGSYKSI